jgi:hypothetical protein
MMYAFGGRPDVAVLDEPFYAPYLAVTGASHPMREAILRAHESDPARVAELCACDGGPGGEPHVYQKHMAHHAVAGMPMGWAEGAAHLHLIRHPARVIASYGAKRDEVTEADIGFLAQAALFDRLGGIVLASEDVRADPGRMLRRLCAELGLGWTPAMLAWRAGGRPEDGAWAPHWYGAVHRSTGFAGPEGPLPVVDRTDLLRTALPIWEAMRSFRIRP